MENTFITLSPKHPRVAQYIDYYYVDIKPNNHIFQYNCFPHYNNTISIYQSHRVDSIGEVIFDAQVGKLQLFTPIRDKILTVKQYGQVRRVVIVFKPFGIQHFFKGLNFTEYIINYPFFTDNEICTLFEDIQSPNLAVRLDQMLLPKFDYIKNWIIENACTYIFKNYENFSVDNMAQDLNITRRHLSRIFSDNLGVSVKRFAQIVLFRKLMQTKINDLSTLNFTSLAYLFNLSDQSHLNKLIRGFTNQNPTLFFDNLTLLGSTDTYWQIK